MSAICAGSSLSVKCPASEIVAKAREEPLLEERLARETSGSRSLGELGT
jgi:hypothetical protein